MAWHDTRNSPDQDGFPEPLIGGGGGGGSGFGDGAGWNDGDGEVVLVLVLVADGAVRAGAVFVVPWPDAGCERRGCDSERGGPAGCAPRDRKPGLSHAEVARAIEPTTKRRRLRQVIIRYGSARSQAPPSTSAVRQSGPGSERGLSLPDAYQALSICATSGDAGRVC